MNLRTLHKISKGNTINDHIHKHAPTEVDFVLGLYRPAAHLVHALAPAADHEPAEQLKQFDADVLLHLLLYVPTKNNNMSKKKIEKKTT